MQGARFWDGSVKMEVFNFVFTIQTISNKIKLSKKKKGNSPNQNPK